MNINIWAVAAVVALIIVVLASWFAYVKPLSNANKYTSRGGVNPESDIYKDFIKSVYDNGATPTIKQEVVFGTDRPANVSEALRHIGMQPEHGAPYGRRQTDVLNDKQKIDTDAFVARGQAIALAALSILDQRSKNCGNYLLTALAYIKNEGADGLDLLPRAVILVRRADLEKWREEWIGENGAGREETDIVTPFDHYFYG